VKTLFRYDDLLARKIVKSRAQLQRLIQRHRFPPGKLISPNCRVWEETELDAWFAARPTENSRPLQGRAAELVDEAARKRAVAGRTDVKSVRPTKSKAKSPPPPAVTKRKRAAAPQSKAAP
jgi:predicted DNA-binding transcriptional regulator AlpA